MKIGDAFDNGKVGHSKPHNDARLRGTGRNAVTQSGEAHDPLGVGHTRHVPAPPNPVEQLRTPRELSPACHLRVTVCMRTAVPARPTYGFEPNPLSQAALERPIRDSNPCRRRERAVS
jgi:hypothetical protein